MTNKIDHPKANGHNQKDIIIIEDSEDEKVIKNATVTKCKYFIHEINR